jgi:NAD(P)-dependent dehydrogenase (short-subunit alcohol dehydrogenase family)
LGYEVALVLAQHGANVILAGRNAKSGNLSVNKICSEFSQAQIKFEAVDLADLASVEDLGKRMQAEHHSLDILINNAGVMTPPQRKETKDGFELQFGTNYLGHFALTAQLFPLLQKGDHARVVMVSSNANRAGVINFDDLQSKKKYNPMDAYAQSKLAMLMFSLELQRRSNANNYGVLSFSSHPGIARTDLLRNGPGESSALSMVFKILPFMRQTAKDGALPTIYAATSPNVSGGGYYGPGGFGEIKGLPKPSAIPKNAKDTDAAKRLWTISEELTNIDFH